MAFKAPTLQIFYVQAAPADAQLRQRVRQMLEEQRRLVDDLQAQIGEDGGWCLMGGGCKGICYEYLWIIMI